jgi:hypothetical protein
LWAVTTGVRGGRKTESQTSTADGLEFPRAASAALAHRERQLDLVLAALLDIADPRRPLSAVSAKTMRRVAGNALLALLDENPPRRLARK